MDVDQVRRLALAERALVGEHRIDILDARELEARPLVDLYESALNRGDWFGNSCNTTNLLHLAKDFVLEARSSDRTLFFAFANASHDVVGATVLRSTSSGFLIDETQIDPARGRRKGIMPAYFRRIIPILDLAGRYWTEFVLTPGSRILRKVLIDELGMVVTGLKPDYYLSPVTGLRFSALVAYGPHAAVRGILAIAPRESIGGLLEIVTGCPSQEAASPPCQSSLQYEEVSAGWENRREFQEYRERGFLPVECNPFLRTTTLAKFPIDRLSSLHFLADEGSETPARLLEYCRRSTATP